MSKKSGAVHSVQDVYLRNRFIELMHMPENSASEVVTKARGQIGLAYLKGDGIPKNTTEGVRWLEQAANKGDVNATAFLGIIYYTGEDVRKDLAKAAHWLEKAARQNDSFAAFTLAELYYRGEGVKNLLSAPFNGSER